MQQPPVHIVSLMGRLGNQMFQYAFWLGLKHKYSGHIGYLHPTFGENELSRLFGIPCELFLDKEEVERMEADFASAQINFIQEETCQFQAIDTDESLLTFYNGYWQTERYFSAIADEIRKTFTFHLDLLNEKTRQLAAVIQKQEAVSVHIRRGDYCSQHNKLIYSACCDDVYYANAITLIREHAPSASCFYLFSDEPDWVKANFQLENSIVVDWNQGEDYWQDMYLMSLCRHHIIANSTFSWWGAWLDDRPDKIVIAPHRWFNNRFTPDILPADWLHVYPTNYQRNKQIDQLEYGTIRPDGYGLFDGRMGIVLFLYHYSRYSGDLFYERVAENMLDIIWDHLPFIDSIGYGNGLAGIGYGIEYLIRNGFVGEDSDDILSELDDYLADHYMDCKDLSLEYGLEGLIRYFQLRVDGKLGTSQVEVNKMRLAKIQVFAKDAFFEPDIFLNL